MRFLNRLLAAALMVMSMLIVCADAEAAISKEETRYFVDEVNHMGYYVDIATVNFDSHRTFNVEVSVVRSQDRIMFVYTARFDIETGAYQYLDSKVYRYAGKQLIGSNNTPTPAQSYVDVPQIRAIVNFVMDWHRRYPNDFYVPPPPPPPPPPPVEEKPAAAAAPAPPQAVKV